MSNYILYPEHYMDWSKMTYHAKFPGKNDILCQQKLKDINHCFTTQQIKINCQDCLRILSGET